MEIIAGKTMDYSLICEILNEALLDARRLQWDREITYRCIANGFCNQVLVDNPGLIEEFRKSVMFNVDFEEFG